ncbi:MarR family winged helix-turn-helix transcriptional regulator [Oceanobacillus kimchii]|uniref:MarR family transcriptional regulator n=1 Tax=Oceanobacillus kimchii TaxID=746691 RepID=A0ABQ5TEA1_9BACI|nr:MarR family transcriptional regulator [Oceanobacillus kimchii]GLO64441.1 MarR family transcriptional regulator [Oceanobacillus kimchii]
MEENLKEAEKFRYIILAVQRRGNKLLKEYLKEIGVTPSQSEVISILKNEEYITLKDLGRLLICEEGSPSRLVERMVKDQLIERVRDKNDSRFVRLVLTSLGHEKYSLIIRAEAKMYTLLEQIYTIDELQVLNQILGKLLIDTSFERTLEERGYSMND